MNAIEEDIYLSEYKKNGIPEYIKEAVDLLDPIKKLMCALESDNTSLYNVFPLLDYTLDVYHNMFIHLIPSYFYSTIPIIRNLIVSRFQQTARFDLIISSFSLTFEGRNFFRKFYAKSNPPLTEDFSDQEEGIQSDLFDDDVFVEYSSEIEDDDIFEEMNQVDIQDIIESSSEYDEDIDSESPIDNDTIKSNEDSEEGSIMCGLSIETLLDTISNVAERIGFDEDSIEDIRCTFYDWLLGPSRNLKHLEMLKSSPWRYWKYMNFEKQLKNLPIIALRLISLPASEACCERMISQNRRIIDSYRMNSSDELIKARNTLRTNK